MATEQNTQDKETKTSDKQLSSHLLNTDTWIRLLYMIVFGLLSVLARMVIWVVAVLQFLLFLVMGQGNKNLQYLGQGTSIWIYQAYLFLTFNSDEKPFPFSDWPEISMSQSSDFMTRGVDGMKNSSDAELETTDTSGDADDVPTFLDTDVVGSEKEKKNDN